MTLSSADELRAALVLMFPDFAPHAEEGAAETYHQVIMELTPHITRYLERGAERATRDFAALVNGMVDAGGAQQNAIETCLLEHASQLKCSKLLKPHLSASARKELR